MRELPTGTVTFLFTDVEGSTWLLHEHGERYADLLAEHRRVLRAAFVRHGGVEVDTQGDAFFVAFASARAAVAAAAEGQAALSGPVRVRIGLHTGEAQVTEEGYVGLDVHRAARIAAAGHGGQVLVSASTRALAETELTDLGEHRLKDLSASERLYQLGDAEFPPLKTLYRTNLPVQPYPLVGRRRELAEIMAFLRDGTRLLTLTGAGGSGKTRLALHAASELAHGFPDGAWFVPLAPVTDPGLVEPTVAQALGLRGELRDELRSKRLLLVLDNLEQLLDAAPTVARIVAEAPEVRVLVTSRERLALSAEQEYVVPTLPPTEAVELFTQRARRLKPAFEPDAHVEEIARRLDGLPLALELAAALVKVLTPGQIVERLEQSLDLLTGGSRDVPQRQRTLRATIEWSHRLLGEGDRALFARLGAFAAGFDLTTAERVVDATPDGLSSLVDKSLLRQTGEEGFFMLETIRAFAAERLEPDELERLRRRQFELVEEAAELAEPEHDRPVAWYDAIHAMLPDLRVALAWALDREPVRATRAICRLRGYWLVRGPLREGSEWLERALERRSSLHDDLLADALASIGQVLFFRNDPASAAAAYRESIELWRRLGDRSEVAWATNGYANALWALGEHAETVAIHEQALAEYRAMGDARGVARTLHYMGEEYLALGEHERAREMLQQSIEVAEATEAVHSLITSLHSLADLELDERRLENAEALYRRSLDVARDVNDLRTAAYCLAGMASVAALRGHPRVAGARWRGAEALEEEIGARMLHVERERYERVLTPMENDASFRIGYDQARTTPTIDCR